MDQWFFVIVADSKGVTELQTWFESDEDVLRDRLKSWGHDSVCIFDDLQLLERFAIKHEGPLYMTGHLLPLIQKLKQRVAKGLDPMLTDFDFNEWHDAHKEGALL